LNPDSVADPWIYRLYLTLNQGRFDEARSSLDRMLLWRQQQEPLVSAMNRAEHFLVSASFLLIAGYAEDAAKLSQTALNQPDRNGSYSADDAQKDAYAALINMHANRTLFEIEKEQGVSLGWSELPSHQLRLFDLRLQAWRAERRAASLFASFDTLQNRVRPYAPLDVHIPEWLEPELVKIIGTGIMNQILDQALANGAFQLNDGYFNAYKTEIHAQEGDADELIRSATTALAKLPDQEILLRARISARLARAHWQRGEAEEANAQFVQAFSQDPSVIRRLQTTLPCGIPHRRYSPWHSKWVIYSASPRALPPLRTAWC
jgi:tetratricopeptide (TPR) repeat protein